MNIYCRKKYLTINDTQYLLSTARVFMEENEVENITISSENYPNTHPFTSLYVAIKERKISSFLGFESRETFFRKRPYIYSIMDFYDYHFKKHIQSWQYKREYSAVKDLTIKDVWGMYPIEKAIQYLKERGLEIKAD